MALALARIRKARTALFPERERLIMPTIRILGLGVEKNAKAQKTDPICFDAKQFFTLRCG